MKKLSIFMALTVLLLVPLSVKADSELQGLIQNGTVTLDKDYVSNEPTNIPEGMNVTIDLNGHTIQATGNSGIDAIRNYGTLTIKGEGLITAVGAAIVNYPGATATLDNGEYLSTGWYTIKNMGHMTINNLIFGNNVNNGASLIDNGFYGSTSSDRGQLEANANDNTVSMTINGGTFTNKNNSCNVIKNDDWGNLVINGGTFTAGSDDATNANPVVQNWHKATINDGVFNSINGFALTNGFWDATLGVGLMTINGGTFSGTRGIFADNGSATPNQGRLTINGGTYTGTVTMNHVYELVINGGVFSDNTVTPSDPAKESFHVIGTDQVIIASEEDLVANLETNAVKEAEIDATTLDLIKKAINDDEVIGAFYEINLFKTVEGLNVEQVENAPDKVKVTLKLPALEQVKEGYNRTYYMIRIHDGKADILDVTVNNDGTFSFETDKFSTYALAYKDTLVTSDKKDEVKNPDTLDAATVYIALFGLGVAGAFGSYKYINKRKENI